MLSDRGSRDRPLWPVLSRDLMRLCARSCLQQQIGSGSWDNLHISAVRVWLTAAVTARVHDTHTQRRGCTRWRGLRTRLCACRWKRTCVLLNVDETEDGGGCSPARATRRARAERWRCFGLAGVRNPVCLDQTRFLNTQNPPSTPPPTPVFASRLQLHVHVTFTEVIGQGVTSPVQVL